MAHGPAAGPAVLGQLEDDDRLGRNHRLPAVRAHLSEMAGDEERARCDYRAAARLTTSLPEQRYLLARAARLADRTERAAGVDQFVERGEPPRVDHSGATCAGVARAPRRDSPRR